MSNYYQEVIEQIKAAIAQKDYNQARFLLQQELNMPYIPNQIETQLVTLAKQLNAMDKNAMNVDIDVIIKWIADKETVAMALESLRYVNLKAYPDYLNVLADKVVSKEGLASLLIEYKQQGVEGIYQGVDIKKCQLPYDNDGFRQLYQLIEQQWQKDAYMKQILHQNLVHEYLCCFPNYYQSQQLQAVYGRLVYLAFSLSNDMNAWYDYQAKNHLNGTAITLQIEDLALIS